VVVKLQHACEIDGADHVDVVQNKRFLAFKKPPGLLQSAACIEQYILTRYLNVHSEISVRFQIFDHGIGEMMHIDDHVVNAEFAQPGKCDFQECSAGDFDERFWPVVGERPKPRAEPGGKDHRLHFPRVSSPMWRTITSTPDFSCRCFARRSAKNTERCCPPVQPKDTVKLLKPRR